MASRTKFPDLITIEEDEFFDIIIRVRINNACFKAKMSFIPTDDILKDMGFEKSGKIYRKYLK